jgi:hypothetical protein
MHLPLKKHTNRNEAILDALAELARGQAPTSATAAALENFLDVLETWNAADEIGPRRELDEQLMESWRIVIDWTGAQAVSAIVAAATARDISADRPYYSPGGPREAWEIARCAVNLPDCGYDLNQIYDKAQRCRAAIDRPHAAADHPKLPLNLPPAAAKRPLPATSAQRS